MYVPHLCKIWYGPWNFYEVPMSPLQQTKNRAKGNFWRTSSSFLAAPLTSARDASTERSAHCSKISGRWMLVSFCCSSESPQWEILKTSQPHNCYNWPSFLQFYPPLSAKKKITNAGWIHEAFTINHGKVSSKFTFSVILRGSTLKLTRLGAAP